MVTDEYNLSISLILDVKIIIISSNFESWSQSLLRWLKVQYRSGLSISVFTYAACTWLTFFLAYLNFGLPGNCCIYIMDMNRSCM